MSESSFIGYVGDADFHDGRILNAVKSDNSAHVRIRGGSGQIFVVIFDGVSAMRARCAEGMMLYALAEVTCDPPLRRFVFLNWDENEESHLEVEALNISTIVEE